MAVIEFLSKVFNHFWYLMDNTPLSVCCIIIGIAILFMTKTFLVLCSKETEQISPGRKVFYGILIFLTLIMLLVGLFLLVCGIKSLFW